MLACAHTFAVLGLSARPVTVEADIRPGLPAFTVVGLADTAVREARERVRSALLNSGFEFPPRRITVNLAPADLRKVGPGFDLALAAALLAASGQVPRDAVGRYAVFGELSLAGEVRPVRGTLAVAEAARATGRAGLILARAAAAEAALVEGLGVGGADTVGEMVELLGGRRPFDAAAAPLALRSPPLPDSADPDLSDVRGHPAAVTALELAAAGGHNLLLEGPPGTGKTMLARRLPGILPPLTLPEAIEVTRIRSAAGLHRDEALVSTRPFRAPHHTISPAGLVGGGAAPAPGEASLAHHGVLFLDELSEFARTALEALRQPLEDGHVTIVRGQQAVVFPTRFTLVAATNPCPCGFGHGDERCTCAPVDIARHRRRLSGPLLDRIDLVVPMGRPRLEQLSGAGGTTSAAARARVVAARERQQARVAGLGVRCNAELRPRQLRAAVRLTATAERALAHAHERLGLSGRGHHRLLRVARTAADLAGRECVQEDDVHLALSLRLPTAAQAA